MDTLMEGKIHQEGGRAAGQSYTRPTSLDLPTEFRGKVREISAEREGGELRGSYRLET